VTAIITTTITTLILSASLVMAILAAVLAILLYIASKRFEVKKDPKLKKIVEVLPGVNCGACGFPGCEAFAKAVLEGKAKFDGCKVGKEKVAMKVKEVLEGKQQA